MDSFDNFQYDSTSSYGVVDDNSSVYTANTQDNSSSVDLSNLSIQDYPATHGRPTGLEEDFDDVKDDSNAVDLPPHACR